MKKLLSLTSTLLILLILMHVSAFAEAFSLRNGILFGDSYDTIVKKETFNFSAEEDMILSNGHRQVFTEKGTVAGIDGCMIMFRLTPDDKLYEMKYDYSYIPSKDEVEYDYSTIYDGLIRKYGEPLNSTEGKVSRFTTNAIDSAIGFTSIYNSMGIDADYLDYDEWLVYPDDGGVVKIDLIDYYSGDSSDRDYYLNVGYRYFSADEVNQMTGDNKTVTNSIDDDL